MREAEAHADDDAERRALVELRNTGDGLIYSVGQTLGLYGEKLEGSERGEIETAVDPRQARRSPPATSRSSRPPSKTCSSSPTR